MDMDGHGWTIDCCWTQIHHESRRYKHWTLPALSSFHSWSFDFQSSHGTLQSSYEIWTTFTAVWAMVVEAPSLHGVHAGPSNDSTVFWLSFQNVASLSTAWFRSQTRSGQSYKIHTGWSNRNLWVLWVLWFAPSHLILEVESLQDLTMMTLNEGTHVLLRSGSNWRESFHETW